MTRDRCSQQLTSGFIRDLQIICFDYMSPRFFAFNSFSLLPSPLPADWECWGLGLRNVETNAVLIMPVFTVSMPSVRIVPILARIGESRSAVLCPMIDAIDDKSLEYSSNGGIAVGGFTWSLHFTWRSIPKHEQQRRKASTDPLRYASAHPPLPH